MKRLFTAALVYAACFAVTSFAQAPDSVANRVLQYQSYSAMGDHRWTYGYLTADSSGTLHTLWLASSRLRDYTVLPPTATPTTYTKLSATEAKLNGTLGSEIRLIFSGPTSGTVMTGPDGIGTFTLRTAQAGLGAANVSMRTNLAANEAGIVGFILPPGAGRLVLIRAVGATLTDFGVAGAAQGMQVSLYTGADLVAPVDPSAWDASVWSASAFSNLFTVAGAFPLTASRGEACILAELPAGTYTAVVHSNSPGQTLVEVYFLP